MFGWYRVVGGIVSVVLLIVVAGLVGFVVGLIKSKETNRATVLEEIPLQPVASGNFICYVISEI